MPARQISNSFIIEIDGAPLPDDVAVARVSVEDYLHLPDAFTVVLRDMARDGLRKARATIGAKVEIFVLSDIAPSRQKLISGEVTALEAELRGGASFSIVRGYDESHRLFRGRTTESYRNMAYSDVAGKVARRNGLKPGTIDATSPTHQHITQGNENDWEFLGRLAREVGFEVAVAGGKLHFRKPATSTVAPPPSTLEADADLTLLAGSHLLDLHATTSAAQQVKEVQVRGWDVATKKALVGSAAPRTETIVNGASAAKLADAFPGPVLVLSSSPYGTAKEVDLAARAWAEHIASGHTEMEGAARGNPHLKAGVAVRIGLLGEPFDGTYLLTSTRHSYDSDDGYVTSFVISGREERSLLGLAHANGSKNGRMIVNGVVPALVDDVNDPNNQCRVRLRFPWLAEKFVSDWSRVAQAGAGKDRGLLVLPEVGDEVLVAFEQGDVGRPFVLGGLYNGQDKARVGPGRFLDGSSGAVNNRLFTSRQGHQLVFVDADDGCGVQITTGDGKIRVRLDQSESLIEISSGGDLEIKSDGTLKIEAKGALELKGRSVKVEAQSDVQVKASQVAVEGSGPVQIKGKPIQLN